jgi:phosphoglycolate phosphatase-like HAD superfamily hydrolase
MALRYQHVIFDFDGVLVDSVEVKGKAFAKLYEPFGETISKRVLEYHNQHGGVSRLEKFKHFHQVFLEMPLSENALNTLCDKFSTIVKTEVIEADWISGAKSFLENYYQRLQFFVASATPEVELKDIMKHRHMTAYFKGVYGAPKPKKQIVRDTLTTHELDSKATVMIGDAMTDYEAAIDNQIDFIGVGLTAAKCPKASALIKDLSLLHQYIEI